MSKLIFTCCLLLAVPFTLVASFDCSGIHEELTSGVLNYLANVSIVVPETTTGKGWSITLKFDQVYTGIGVWVGWISNYGESMYSIITNNNETQDLIKGEIFNFNFRINYGRDIPKPKLISLEFYDIQMCR